MAEHGEQRRLTAILALDMVGYSRLMEADERDTIARHMAHRGELIDPNIADHHGRIASLAGDGMIVEFASVVEAVECAVAIQRVVNAREADAPEDRRILYRIGINLGDIVVEGDEIFGDGVNIAARLEEIAEPGGVCVSGTAYDQFKQVVDVGYEYLGERRVKNIEKPIRVYRVLLDPAAAGKVIGEGRSRSSRRQRGAIAAAVALVAIGGALAWLEPWAPRQGDLSIDQPAEQAQARDAEAAAERVRAAEAERARIAEAERARAAEADRQRLAIAAAEQARDAAEETLRKAAELVFWSALKDSANPADYDVYLEKYPDGEFAELARARKDEVVSAALAADAEQERLAERRAADDAARKQAEQRAVERALWEAVEASPSAADYQIYLQQYPNGIYAALAQTRLAEAEREAAAIEADRVFWQSVENSTSIADFEAYLKKYPDGDFADLARNRIDSLKETQTAAIVTPTLDVPSTKSMPPSDDDVEPRITLYDGTWSVAMHTSVGRCRPVYRYKITVRSGEISGYLTARAGKYIVSGTVARDGSFKSLIAGGDYVNANGKLKGNSGKGTWRSQSGCKGTSEFERIGAP